MGVFKLIKETLKEMLAKVRKAMHASGRLSESDPIAAYALLSEAIGAASAIATVATLLAQKINSSKARNIGEGALADVAKLNSAAMRMREDMLAQILSSLSDYSAPTESPPAPQSPQGAPAESMDSSPPVESVPPSSPPTQAPPEGEQPLFHPREVNATD